MVDLGESWFECGHAQACDDVNGVNGADASLNTAFGCLCQALTKHSSLDYSTPASQSSFELMLVEVVEVACHLRTEQCDFPTNLPNIKIHKSKTTFVP